jgi:hypothetical protein
VAIVALLQWPPVATALKEGEPAGCRGSEEDRQDSGKRGDDLLPGVEELHLLRGVAMPADRVRALRSSRRGRTMQGQYTRQEILPQVVRQRKGSWIGPARRADSER